MRLEKSCKKPSSNKGNSKDSNFKLSNKLLPKLPQALHRDSKDLKSKIYDVSFRF